VHLRQNAGLIHTNASHFDKRCVLTFVLNEVHQDKEKAQLRTVGLLDWWPGAESNCRHADFQAILFEKSVVNQHVIETVQ